MEGLGVRGVAQHPAALAAGQAEVGAPDDRQLRALAPAVDGPDEAPPIPAHSLTATLTLLRPAPALKTLVLKP